MGFLKTLVQSCLMPASCVHAIKLDAEYQDNNGKVTIHKEYTQNKQLDDVYLYDTTGKGANLTVELVGKGCATKNPDCPSGVLYTDHSAKKIKAGTPFKENLNFPKVDSSSSKFINFINFIDGCILGNLKSLPAVKYELLFFECNGKKELGELFKIIQHGEETSLSPVQKGTVVSSSKVILFPKIKWEASVNIVLSRNVEIKKGKTRRKSKIKTVTTIKKTKKASIAINGDTKLTIGDTPHSFTKTMAEEDYQYHSSKSKFITNLKKIKTLSESFTQGDNKDFKLVTAAFILPTISLAGSGELNFSKQHKPYLHNEATVAIKDLLNFSVTLDLIQALGKAYKIDKALARARKKAEEQEKLVKEEGKSGLYWGAKCDLIFRAKASVKFNIKTTETKPWDVTLKPLKDATSLPEESSDAAQNKKLQPKKSKNGSIEALVSITALINVRFGSKINVLEGAFEGNINASVEASATAEACATVVPNGDKTELILHHNGIWAEVKIDWEAVGKLGRGNVESKKSKFENRQKKQTNYNDESKVKKGTKSYKWQIYPPCKKEDSKVKTFLFEKNERTEILMSHEYYFNPFGT